MNNSILIFIISIGDLGYTKYSEDILSDYFNHNNIEHFFLKKDDEFINYKKAHPSWLKLLSHKYITTDKFILCWDLDLLPVNKDFNILNHIDLNKINMCYDTGMLLTNFKFNSNFYFNGGLIGIPKEERVFMESIYNTYAPGSIPSYEQYYLNDCIAEQNKNVNRLPDKFNSLYPPSNIDKSIFNNAQNKHYTWGIKNNNHRTDLIKEHHKLYFK